MSSEKVVLDAGKVLGMLIQNGVLRLPSSTFSSITTMELAKKAAKEDALYLQTFVDELKNLSQEEKKE